MANKLYNDMQNQQNSMENGFVQFMEQMRGQNPRAIIDEMVRSGKVSQQQLNAVQQRAQQMGGMFGRMRSRFGF
jgi:hypothetical protein